MLGCHGGAPVLRAGVYMGVNSGNLNRPDSHLAVRCHSVSAAYSLQCQVIIRRLGDIPR